MKLRSWVVPMGVILAVTLVGVAGVAQQPPPAVVQGGGRRGQQAPGAGRGAPTAPPPIIWPAPPLSGEPLVLDTAIQHQLRVVPTKGLNQPWSLAFLPDGGILVTERPGRLRIIRNGILDPKPVAGLPQVRAQGIGGLMDLALHPRFTENKLIYFTYHKPSGSAAPNAPGGNAPGVITLARARWDGTSLVDAKDLFSATPSGNASRIIFGRDGMLYMTVGFGDPLPPYTNVASLPPQDPNSLAGKVLRL